MYLRAFTKMLERREERGRSGSWKTAEDVMNWWIPKQTWPLEIHELPHNEAGYWSKGYHTEEEFTAAYPVQIGGVFLTVVSANAKKEGAAFFQ